jgi:L-ascorbate metabolism protein UlaG (beta-lactamase superfamily)
LGSRLGCLRENTPSRAPLPENIDLILLSQGLEDHAHPPTLKALDKSIPVVGSASAAKVAQSLGFTQVTALAHGERFTLADSVTIQAVPGSPIGPTTVENGYILRDAATGHSLFYEPHGFHAPSLKDEGPIDVVITPVLDLALPLVGPIIRGQKGALELTEWLQPQVILPTADAGEVQYSGFLISLLKAIGG